MRETDNVHFQRYAIQFTGARLRSPMNMNASLLLSIRRRRQGRNAVGVATKSETHLRSARSAMKPNLQDVRLHGWGLGKTEKKQVSVKHEQVHRYLHYRTLTETCFFSVLPRPLPRPYW